MQRRVEVELGVQTYPVDVEIGDLATIDHAVERARQQLLQERPELAGFRFQRGCVVQ